MIALTALLVTVAAPLDEVKMTFLPSGAVKKVGGYMPIRAEMSEKADVKATPDGLVAPMFGKIVLEGKSFDFVLEEPAGKPARLFIDANGDGDLTNDPAVAWAPQGNDGMYMGSAKVQLKGQPASISFYRFDPKDPGRQALKNTLLYYKDYGYEVQLDLDGKKFLTYITGEPAPNVSLAIDRNSDKKISYQLETVKADKPFNFTGTTYVLKVANGKLNLDKAAEKIAMTPMPPDLSVGKKSLTFVADTTDGQKVKFPTDYKGRIVMIDFWATWCGPCIAELPNVKAAYAKYHDQGFEILGISFDKADMADKLKEFTVKNDMPWRQVYEGKYWSTEIGAQFDVNGIPFTLLVDGDSGTILATGDQMRGPGLSDLIDKALAKKRSSR